jgi:hypothetical protein
MVEKQEALYRTSNPPLAIIVSLQLNHPFNMMNCNQFFDDECLGKSKGKPHRRETNRRFPQKAVALINKNQPLHLTTTKLGVILQFGT